MIPNADCTVFTQKYDPATRKNSWVATVIRGVFWQGSIGSRLGENGRREDNETVIFIPFSTYLNAEIKSEDKIYKGAADVTTPIGLEGALTVTGVDTFDYGSADMQHWEVTAK